MKEDYKGYAEFLEEELARYKGDFDDFILHMPDFFRLLSNLLNEDIEKKDRRKINCVLGYFVAPADVIPEEVHGPYGYVDDIFLCCTVLEDLKEKYGIGFLESSWEHDEDLETVIEDTYEKSSEIIEEKGLKDDILEYTGLSSY